MDRQIKQRPERSSIYHFIPLDFERIEPEAGLQRVREFHQYMKRRRSIRDFSSEPVPRELIDECIRIAGTAPSGANLQPWRFVVVSDPETKRRIRETAEKEERENYERRFPREWLEALAPLGTDWHKEYLEIVPYLIVVFRIDYGLEGTAEEREFKRKHYYVMESVGIAVGMLLTALHTAGLATLTHTPSPMGFLRETLQRPKNETAYVLLPVGYPAPDAEVPDILKKSFDEICVHV